MKTQDKKTQKDKTMMRVLILMTVGFVIDVGQALVVYNAGKSAEAKSLGEKYKWKMPGGMELAKTAGLVLVTSIATGLLVSAVESALIGKEPEPVTT